MTATRNVESEFKTNHEVLNNFRKKNKVANKPRVVATGQKDCLYRVAFSDGNILYHIRTILFRTNMFVHSTYIAEGKMLPEIW